MNETTSEIIEQMRQQRRVRTGLELAPPGKQVESSPPSSATPLDPRIESLLSDRRFKALFSGHDPTELRSLLEEIDTLLARCSLHHRSVLWRNASRNRRTTRTRRSVEVPNRKSGRPAGAGNFAAQQYGLGLAVIWFEHTGRLPSRYEAKGLHGGYVRFVELVLAAAPPRLRRSPDGQPPAIDYLVRTSVTSFRTARLASEEYRRRGLLDEREWLDRP